MMKQRPLFWVLSVLFAAGVSCKAVRERKSLSPCQFRIGTVTGIELAGVNVQRIRKFADLGLRDATLARIALATGNLPLSMTVHLEVKNPNRQQAALNRLEWVVMVDQYDILSGVVSDSVTIAPHGGMDTIPIPVSVNLRSLLKTMGKNEILEFAMGLTDQSDRPSRVALRVHPAIMVGRHPLEYPAWFTVNREFASQ
ncbi:MAG: hypothetical protein RLZZ165_1278 [Bacteroidota bacterium]|jgi:hypothetical protein